MLNNNIPLFDEISVDIFAGGGGASLGSEAGTGRPVTVAINHDEDAISMHRLNHPETEHYISDIYEVDPEEACAGRPVGHLHASPDCTHHSQASGGQPRRKALRSLSWVVHKWAGKVRPRIITLENVHQIVNWSPLVAKRCKSTNRVIKVDRTVAAPGEVVPVNEQFLVPDKSRKGHNWNRFIHGLRDLGYAVEWKLIKACDYGAPTTRERLFLIARCDNKPIVWPKKTHFGDGSGKTWVSIAKCIDWSVKSQSIFDRPRPLAEATMKRLAKGVKKLVLDNPEPFIVKCNHTSNKTHYPYFRGQESNKPLQTVTQTNGFALAQPVLTPFITEHANASNQRNMPSNEPLRTICATVKGGHFAVAAPYMVQLRKNCDIRPLKEGLRTISAGGQHHGIATAFMTKFRTGSVGYTACGPAHTITAGGDQKRPGTANTQGVVTAALAPFTAQHYGGFYKGAGKSLSEPLPVITAKDHNSLVETTLAQHYGLTKQQMDDALRCADFLLNFYSEADWCEGKTASDLTIKDRLSLVTVWVKGEAYVITDVLMRMLTPRELYRAQSFPDSYIIDRGHDGRKFSKAKQVRFVGNSVPPVVMKALIEPNYQPRGEAVDRLLELAS